MTRLATPQIPGMDGLGLAPVNVNNYYGWCEPLNFSVAIAAGGTGDAVERPLSPEFDIECFRIDAAVYLSAAVTNMIAGTPAAWGAGNRTDADANDWMTRDHFLVELFLNGNTWTSGPVRLSCLCGNAQYPAWLVPHRIIPRGSRMTGKLYNESDQSVKAQLVFHGARKR